MRTSLAAVEPAGRGRSSDEPPADRSWSTVGPLVGFAFGLVSDLTVKNTRTRLDSITHARTHALTHTVPQTQGICVSMCRTIYLSIFLALITCMYLFFHVSILLSVHLSMYLLFHLSIRCCKDAQLRCNKVCIAAAPRCDGMLRRARRHHTTAPASSPPSNPVAECSRVPPEYPAIEPARPPLPLCVRESGGACHTGAAARAGACRTEAHPPHVSTRRVPAEPRPLGSHGARGRHGSTWGVPQRRPCTARVHSLPASHNGCSRDTITQAAAVSGSSAQSRFKGFSRLCLRYLYNPTSSRD